MNTTKEQKLKALQKQLEEIQKEMEDLRKPEQVYIVVKEAKDYNWYKVGDVYKVIYQARVGDEEHYYYPLVSNECAGININHCVFITDPVVVKALDNTFLDAKR